MRGVREVDNLNVDEGPGLVVDGGGVAAPLGGAAQATHVVK